MASVEFFPFTCNPGGALHETSCKHCKKLMGRGRVVLEVRQTATPFKEAHVLCRETPCYCGQSVILPVFFESEDDAQQAAKHLLAVADNIDAFAAITKVVYRMPGTVLPARGFNFTNKPRPFVVVRNPSQGQPAA